jgi:insulysin
MREMLEDLRASRGRALLMAKREKYERLRGPLEWRTEPIYGTQYCVEPYDAEILAASEAPNDNPELFLPGRNEFIPTNLHVEKQEVAEVRRLASIVSAASAYLPPSAARKAPAPYSGNAIVAAVV